MNFNTSPIAFYPSRAAQQWRNTWNQCNIAVVTGDNLPPFIINDAPDTAPATVEIFDPNTDTLIATKSVLDIVSHTSTINGVSVNSWIYQGTSAGIWGFTTPGYYYLKIGNYYSDIIKFGPVGGDYVKMEFQFYDDIITADGSLISKYVVYKQIFETALWHPTYEVNEEGKENNGVFYAMQQITKKTCGFSDTVNEAQLDTLNLARMADNVLIESRSNGVIRTFSTNTFEIKSKWESDDVASFEATFDLFNIIMKCQLSNVAPEPLPIPTPPEPPANYYIKGTATGNSVQFIVNGILETYPVQNGEFSIGYDSPLTMFANYNAFGGDSTKRAQNVKTLDFSESCGLRDVLEFELYQMPELVSVNFAGCTFESLTGAVNLIAGTKVATLSLPNATFASLPANPTYAGQSVVDYNIGMFAQNQQLTSINMPLAVIKGRANGMFYGCKALQTITMPLATFEQSTTTKWMFYGCENLQTIDLSAATFASATNLSNMFNGAGGLRDSDTNEPTLDISTLFPAMAAKPTNISAMCYNAKYVTVDLTALDTSICANMEELFSNSLLRSLYISATQFNATTNAKRMFSGCKYLNYNTITSLADITFANVEDATEMFANADVIYPSKAVELTNATFANAITITSMFENCAFVNIILPAATFASATNADKMFYNCKTATHITLTNTTFASLTSANNLFNNCNALVELTVPSGPTMPVSFGLPQSANMSVDSFNRISQWVKDYTGGAAHNLVLNSTAWAGWSSLKLTAETRMNNKNWTVQH
jgi:hypothetical protein